MRKLAAAIIAVVFLAPAAAEDLLDGYLAGASRADLSSRPSLIRSFREGEELRLAPSVASRETLAAEVRALKPTVGVEVLRLFAGLPRRLDSEEGRLFLLNAIASASSLKGITYWSVTRGKEWVLFRDSYSVESPEHPVRTADPVFDSLPADGRFSTYQEDTSFGKNVYRTVFHARGDHLWVRTENVTPISFLLVPIIPAGNLVSFTLLLPAGNELLFYGVAVMHTTFPIGDRKSRTESLTNRIIAMSDWLQRRISR